MSLLQAVDTWNKERQSALIQSYEKEGLKASGRWASSLEGSTKQQGNAIKTVILGEAYTGALVRGRGITKSDGDGDVTLQENIRQWIDDKSITPKGEMSEDSLSWAIATKIHSKGIKVPNEYNSGNLVNNAFTTNDIAELESIIAKELGEMMKTEVLKAVKK